MPDIYIDTDAAAGGTGTSSSPYNSLNNAWEAEDENIAAGETWNFFCKGTAADTAEVSIDGVFPTTGSPVTINVYPWHTDFGAVSDGDDAWNNAGTTPISTSHYRLVMDPTPNGDGLAVDMAASGTVANVVHIEGLQITISSADTSNATRVIQSQAGQSTETFQIIGCRIQHAGTGDNPRAIRTDCAIKQEFKNNLIYYNGTRTSHSAFNINTASIADIYNNTVIYDNGGGEDVIDDVAGCTLNVYNNVFWGTGATTTYEIDSAGTLNHDYNASGVSADRGTNGFAVDQTNDFIDFANDDFRPDTAANQTNDWGTGGETNGDDSKVPTVDINGNARNTGSGDATAIGCFVPAAGEGGAKTASALVAATSTVAAAPTAVRPAAAVISGTSSATVTPTRTRTATAATSGISTVAATVSRSRPATALIASTSAVTAAPSVARGVAAAIAASSTVAATPTKEGSTQATALVQAASTVATAPSATRPGVAAVAATSAVSAVPSVTRAVQAVIAGTSTVAATGTKGTTKPAVAAIVGQSALIVAAPSVTRTVQAGIAGSSVVVATPIGGTIVQPAAGGGVHAPPPFPYREEDDIAILAIVEKFLEVRHGSSGQ